MPLSFSNSAQGVPGNHSIYKMSSRFSIGTAGEILAGVYSGGVIVDSIKLTVHTNAQQVAFVKHSSNTDTILVAHLDKSGKLLFVRAGNSPDENYLPTSFTYKANRVTEMKIAFNNAEEVALFNYDKKGNLVRILDKNTSANAARVDYQYHPTLTADAQVYFDEPRRYIWNTFSLMQFAGLLPQLNSTNLRTRTTVTWDDNYLAYDLKLTNHRLDEKKKLISYDVAEPISGSIISNYVISWSCNTSLSPLATQ